VLFHQSIVKVWWLKVSGNIKSRREDNSRERASRDSRVHRTKFERVHIKAEPWDHCIFESARPVLCENEINPPASGEICYMDALSCYNNAPLTFVITVMPQKWPQMSYKNKKVVSESCNCFFVFLNEWRICRVFPWVLEGSAPMDGLTFDSRILWYTEEFMVKSVTAGFPGPVAAKQAQIITSYLTVGMRCFCWYAVFGFHQMWCCAL